MCVPPLCARWVAAWVGSVGFAAPVVWGCPWVLGPGALWGGVGCGGQVFPEGVPVSDQTQSRMQTCHKCMRSDVHYAATRCPHCRALLGDRVPRWWGVAAAIACWLVFIVAMKLVVWS